MIMFFVFYFLLMLFGSLIAVGWFDISRGRIEILPDGSEFKTGKLFKGWQFFLEKKKSEPIKRYYAHKPLFDKYMEIKQAAAKFGYTGTFTLSDHFIEYDGNFTLIKQLIEYYTEIKIKIASDSNRFFVYDEYYEFVFPEWIRDPFGMCVTCMASVYGSIVYWATILLVSRETLQYIFSWTGHVNIAIVLTWAAYCFSLAWLNTYISNKIK